MSVEINDKRVVNKLLMGYLFLYPLYYVIAMFFAVAILRWIFGWSFAFSEKIFYIFSGVMWFVSYVAHRDILVFVLKQKGGQSS